MCTGSRSRRLGGPVSSAKVLNCRIVAPQKDQAAKKRRECAVRRYRYLFMCSQHLLIYEFQLVGGETKKDDTKR
jgi:hypothetical protein